MNKQRADELCAALRSGKYKQCRGQLSKGDGFCCLGVACEISGLGKWSSSKTTDPRYEIDEADWNCELLPKTIARKYLQLHNEKAIEANDICFPFRQKDCDEKVWASNLNDQGFTFSQIADLIECFWEEL